MSKTAFRPSFDELAGVIEAAKALRAAWVRYCRFACNNFWEDEERIAVAIGRLSDVIEPYRTLSECDVEGWGTEVYLTLDHLPHALHDAAYSLALTPLLDRPEIRDEWKAQKIETWKGEVERPLYDAVISWARGMSFHTLDLGILRTAEAGEALGYEGTLSAVEGKERFDAALRAWRESPRYGVRAIDDPFICFNDRMMELGQCIGLLEAAMHRHKAEMSVPPIPPTIGETKPASPPTPINSQSGPKSESRRRGRKRKPLSPIETKVMELYDRRTGSEYASLFTIAEDLNKSDSKARITAKGVDKIVRKVKARRKADADLRGSSLAS